MMLLSWLVSTTPEDGSSYATDLCIGSLTCVDALTGTIA